MLALQSLDAIQAVTKRVVLLLLLRSCLRYLMGFLRVLVFYRTIRVGEGNISAPIRHFIAYVGLFLNQGFARK